MAASSASDHHHDHYQHFPRSPQIDHIIIICGKEREQQHFTAAANALRKSLVCSIVHPQ